jgi:hypothetical protein
VILRIGMAGKTKHNLDTVLRAIQGCHGVKKTVADRLKITPNSVDNYLRRWAKANAAFEEEKEAIDDVARHVVIEDIVTNRDVSTAKWWLAKRRPSEFGERVDVTTGGEAIEFDYSKFIRAAAGSKGDS